MTHHKIIKVHWFSICHVTMLKFPVQLRSVHSICTPSSLLPPSDSHRITVWFSFPLPSSLFIFLYNHILKRCSNTRSPFCEISEMLTYQPLVSLWAIGVSLSIGKWRHYSEGNNFKVTMTCQHLHHFVDVDQAVWSELLSAAAWRRSDNTSPAAIMCVMAAIYLQGLSQIWNCFLIVLFRYFYNFRYLEPQL